MAGVTVPTRAQVRSPKSAFVFTRFLDRSELDRPAVIRSYMGYQYQSTPTVLWVFSRRILLNIIVVGGLSKLRLVRFGRFSVFLSILWVQS